MDLSIGGDTCRKTFARTVCHLVAVSAVFALVLLYMQPAHANGGMRNGLPACKMDSFVKEAGQSAELIYGDEGAGGSGEIDGQLPPYFGFTTEHRIESGIVGQTNQGLTTGHASYLPSAVGHDEFLGAEFSGPRTTPSSTNNADLQFGIPNLSVDLSTAILPSSIITKSGF
jgi:hypothetical protein